MGMKALLGLESFPLKDYELIQKLREARSNNVDILEFRTTCGKSVKINLSQLSLDGVMQGNYRMYKKKRRFA
jgi:hypothetical protein